MKKWIKDKIENYEITLLVMARAVRGKV